MERNTSRGKNQVLLSSGAVQMLPMFQFLGSEISSVTNADYLGLTLAAKEYAAKCVTPRVRAVHTSLRQMQFERLLLPRVSPQLPRL